VIIHHLDVEGVATLPAEAEPPLVVDPDAPFAGPVTSQLLQPVARGNPQVVQADGCIQEAKLAEPGPLHIRAPPADGFSVEEALGVTVAEAPDHPGIVTLCVMASKGKPGSALTTCA